MALAHQPLQLLVSTRDGALAQGQRALAPAEVTIAIVELLLTLFGRVFFLGESPLEPLELAAALARGVLELGARLEQLLLGGQVGFFELRLGVARRRFAQPLGFALRVVEDAPAGPAQPVPADPYQHQRGDDLRDQNGQVLSPPPCQAGRGALRRIGVRGNIDIPRAAV